MGVASHPSGKMLIGCRGGYADVWERLIGCRGGYADVWEEADRLQGWLRGRLGEAGAVPSAWYSFYGTA